MASQPIQDLLGHMLSDHRYRAIRVMHQMPSPRCQICSKFEARVRNLGRSQKA
ncbi:hypothetical protein MTR_3g093650 [Medicago truncatula]|uniref:Uncharacterized protein n=1 Tax=Medicago truncatula TaxID=3880 RepID=A0A072V105_MEDTR|nr:hypothetical protein MTR_3g093650 [Medicago truncatula]